MQQVLCYFWRSIKMPLIYYKVELILKWTKYCVLSTAGADNANANLNNITFTNKDTKLFFSIVVLWASDNKKLSKFLSEGFERSVYLSECKAKC